MKTRTPKSERRGRKPLPPLPPGAMMSLREAMEKTGWTREFFKKLRRNGAIKFYKPALGRCAQCWYYRQEIEAIVSGGVQ